MEGCILLGVVALAACGGGAIGLTDGAVRRALHFSLARRFGGVFTPRLIVVGDSLADSCPWRTLFRRPFSVLNLASGGATVKEIAGQIYRSRDIKARCLLVNGGLNDLLADDATPDRIEADFNALFRRLGDGRAVIVTLMPFVADAARARRIAEANDLLSRLCEGQGYRVIDLNPAVSFGGARRPDMTNDGVHFTPAAEAAWLALVRQSLETNR